MRQLLMSLADGAAEPIYCGLLRESNVFLLKTVVSSVIRGCCPSTPWIALRESVDQLPRAVLVTHSCAAENHVTFRGERG
jgi:hypothetical protein